MSSRDDQRGPFDPPDERPRGAIDPMNAARSLGNSPLGVYDSPEPSRAPDDPWRDSPQEAAPQWSLLELFLITTGAALTSAFARVVPPAILSSVLGVLFVLGWLRLHVDDWEPRWAVIAWRTILAAYLVSTLITFFG